MPVTIDKFEYATDVAVNNVWLCLALQQLSYTLTSDAAIAAGTNQRMLIPNSAITSSGNKIRLTLQGVSGGAVTIGGCAIGERSGTTGNFASAPTRITFGGNNTGTLPGSLGTLVSDVITFTVDETKDYLIHIYYSGVSAVRYVTGTLTRYYRDYNTNDTLTADISGLTYTSNSYVVGIKSFEILSGIITCASESTIKKNGAYAIKLVAPQTTSLNKTITRTVSPTINLTDQDNLKIWVRASRTGTNFKIAIHDSGGTTTESNIAITSADTFEEKTIDISAVANANKDAIDSIIITITNADAENTIYLDEMLGYVTDEGTGGGSPRFGGRSGGK
jgi:hypothetical protein